MTTEAALRVMIPLSTPRRSTPQLVNFSVEIDHAKRVATRDRWLRSFDTALYLSDNTAT